MEKMDVDALKNTVCDLKSELCKKCKELAQIKSDHSWSLLDEPYTPCRSCRFNKIKV